MEQGKKVKPANVIIKFFKSSLSRVQVMFAETFGLGPAAALSTVIFIALVTITAVFFVDPRQVNNGFNGPVNFLPAGERIPDKPGRHDQLLEGIGKQCRTKGSSQNHHQGIEIGSHSQLRNPQVKCQEKNGYQEK